MKPDAKDPKKIVLADKWVAYQPENGAAPVDVKCGPNNGLFVADSYNNQINWIPYKDLVAKEEKPAYETVVSEDCGSVVADVRSLAWDEQKDQLLWSNNAAIPSDAGVFAAAAPKSGVKQVDCVKAMCDVGWSKDCAPKVDQVVVGEADKKYWAVADAWNDVQVSKGDAKIYDSKKEIAAVPANGEATYAAAAEDPKRDVLVVADQKNGDVYVAAAKAAPKKIGDVEKVYGVAYNDAYGWNGVNSGSAASLAVGAVLAVAALLL